MTTTAVNIARVILCLFWVALGLSATLAQAETYRYQYISLNSSSLKYPPGYSDFSPEGIFDNGRVYGIAYDSFYNPYIAVHDRGVVTILSPGYTSMYGAVNESGTVGGGVLTDPVNYYTQAALFRGHQTKLIPLLPGDISSDLLDLNDDNTALVYSYDADYNETYSLYKKGQSTKLDFGLTGIDLESLHINNEGIISGNTGYFTNSYGFRHDPSTGKTTMLNPLPTEPLSKTFDINNKGNVLGFSRFFGGTQRTLRIGLWDKKGIFHTYFVQGTPEFPTLSGSSVFNDKNMIIIDGSDNTSYLIPKPGVRLNLADLVVNLPAGRHLSLIFDINNEGDMVGYDRMPDWPYHFLAWFLLKRIDATTPVSAASTVPAAAR